jgi:hypothetical protein
MFAKNNLVQQNQRRNMRSVKPARKQGQFGQHKGHPLDLRRSSSVSVGCPSLTQVTWKVWM